MEQKQLNLGVTQGKTFAELRTTFIARALELGQHKVKIVECDFNKVQLNGTREIIPLVIKVDDETFTRVQYFTANGLEMLAKNAGRQIPNLAGVNLPDMMQALVTSGDKLDMWVVSNVGNDGQTYHNWMFYKPMEVREATADGTGVADIV